MRLLRAARRRAGAAPTSPASSASSAPRAALAGLRPCAPTGLLHRPRGAAAGSPSRCCNVPVALDSWDRLRSPVRLALPPAARRHARALCQHLGAAVRSFFAQRRAAGDRRARRRPVAGARSRRRRPQLRAAAPRRGAARQRRLEPVRCRRAGAASLHLVGLDEAAWCACPICRTLCGACRRRHRPPPGRACRCPKSSSNAAATRHRPSPISACDALPHRASMRTATRAGPPQSAGCAISSRGIAATACSWPRCRLRGRAGRRPARRAARQRRARWQRQHGGSGASSAFVQLAAPWLRTRVSDDLPQRLVSPDGVLAGLIAANALAQRHLPQRCRTRSCATSSKPSRCRPGAWRPTGRGRGWPSGSACSHRSPTAGRCSPMSRTSPIRAWRAGQATRLMASVLRAARGIGEPALFEANGPALWTRVRRQMESLLLDYWREGGLGGASARRGLRGALRLQHDDPATTSTPAA